MESAGSSLVKLFVGIVAAALVLSFHYEDKVRELRATAVEMDCANYDPHTGEWRWIERPKRGDAE